MACCAERRKYIGAGSLLEYPGSSSRSSSAIVFIASSSLGIEPCRRLHINSARRPWKLMYSGTLVAAESNEARTTCSNTRRNHRCLPPAVGAICIVVFAEASRRYVCATFASSKPSRRMSRSMSSCVRFGPHILCINDLYCRERNISSTLSEDILKNFAKTNKDNCTTALRDQQQPPQFFLIDTFA